ncbi:MAG: type II secretion system protein [Coleofasciculaceae cyanobacterium RL_1_1]|nr:type II secretion system protein [Coleofasciculaceae cyanobacterium RL_1_1]
MVQLSALRSPVTLKHHNLFISKTHQSVAGFTVIELAIVVVMVGILAAIAAPGWQLFRDRQTVNTVNERLHLAIREAQIDPFGRNLTGGRAYVN